MILIPVSNVVGEEPLYHYITPGHMYKGEALAYPSPCTCQCSV